MDCYLIGPDTADRVKSWEGAWIQPTTTFDADICGDLDMLFVPGGENVVETVIVNNDPCLEFLAKHNKTKWIRSVCTGVLVLGAAGPLEGYTCTTHWAYKDALRLFPA
jgi:cyclohexyl-isocyanide hydratase